MDAEFSAKAGEAGRLRPKGIETDATLANQLRRRRRCFFHRKHARGSIQMRMLRLIIVGAGGLGREVYEYSKEAFAQGEYGYCGFIDDSYNEGDTSSAALLGAIDEYEPMDTDRLLLAIGEPRIRSKISEVLIARGAHFATLIHPKSHVASSATIGVGSIIAPFATLGAFAHVGAFTHVHFYASAAHDTHIGDCVSISPYAVANGGAHLGDGAFLGTRSTVNPGRQVGEASKVTAGSVVYQDVPAFSIAHGNPAKVRRQMSDHPLSAGKKWPQGGKSRGQ